MHEAEEYLNRIPMWATKKNSRSDIRAYLEELGSPDHSMRIIHVAGTNGKGSVCSYLTSVLRAAGYQTATFTSPHLVEVRERFQINGAYVEEDTFCRAFEQVRRLSDTMTARGYHPPTYFEFLFYMFIVMAEWQKPDFVILETGLGGRLDVTNVIQKPVMTVITSISMDHMMYLGDTVEAIAGEKAGIIKPKVPLVFDASSQEAEGVIRRQAELMESPWIAVTEADYELIDRTEAGISFCLKKPGGSERILQVASQADYQMMNASLAVCALEELKKRGICQISEDALLAGIGNSFWPGRMEQIAKDVYLDGAHNAGGVRALNQMIRRMQKESGKSVTLMFGAVSDKDHHEMIRTICDGIELSQVIIAHMSSKRGADTTQLAAEFAQALEETGQGRKISVFTTVREAWEYFIETKGEDLAFCAGSLYLVGEVKSLLSGGTT